MSHALIYEYWRSNSETGNSCNMGTVYCYCVMLFYWLFPQVDRKYSAEISSVVRLNSSVCEKRAPSRIYFGRTASEKLTWTLYCKYPSRLHSVSALKASIYYNFSILSFTPHFRWQRHYLQMRLLYRANGQPLNTIVTGQLVIHLLFN
jgi:hypothetical protein